MRIGPSWPPWRRLTASCAAAWPAPRIIIPPDMLQGMPEPRKAVKPGRRRDTTAIPPFDIPDHIRDTPMAKKVAKKPAKRPPYRLKDISDEQMSALQRALRDA